MFRVYKDFLQRVYVLLVYYREMGYNFQHAAQYTKDNLIKRGRFQRYDNDALNQSIVKTLSFLSNSSKFKVVGGDELDDLLIQIGKQLESSAPENDRDLIDTIVRILQFPYHRQVLAASSLTALKQALLLPEEIVDFKATVAREMYCASCGHQFMNGEMSTVTQAADNGRGGALIICTRCSRPTHVASDSDVKVSLSISEIKGLQRELNKKHLSPEQPAAAQEQAPVNIEPDNQAEIAQRLRADYLLDEAIRAGGNPIVNEAGPARGGARYAAQPRAGRAGRIIVNQAPPPVNWGDMQRNEAEILWNIQLPQPYEPLPAVGGYNVVAEGDLGALAAPPVPGENLHEPR